MVLELRPRWCLSDELVADMISLEEWKDSAGSLAFSRTGDQWKPGDSVRLSRAVSLKEGLTEIRRRFDLGASAQIGLAARWTCRATSVAGTHVGGPKPLPLNQDPLELVLEVPSSIAQSLEVETCLVVNWAPGTASSNSCPDGAMLWSDGWSASPSRRTVLLEGDQLRIPINSVSFFARFGSQSSALWHIEVETEVELDDLVANSVSVLLNRDDLERDFLDHEGSPDANLLTLPIQSGIQVELVSGLTAALLEQLGAEESPTWESFTPGTVAHLVTLRLVEAYGSVPDALADFRDDRPSFNRMLWNLFAPNSWRERK